MPAIAVRNVSDGVHARLREVAAGRGVSVESFVRSVIAEAVLPQDGKVDATPTGFSEVMAPRPVPSANIPQEASMPELWGALKGSVHVPPGVDLSAPLDEDWRVEA